MFQIVTVISDSEGTFAFYNCKNTFIQQSHASLDIYFQNNKTVVKITKKQGETNGPDDEFLSSNEAFEG